MSENIAIKTYEQYRSSVEEAADYIEHFDILETITNVGNDEVFTPRKVCTAMLDSLPHEVWHNPNYHWLNPATKNGVFEREIAIRLNEGLKDIIPDEETRKKHILQDMIFSIGQTKFTSLVARRTLYYCSYANRKDDGIVAEDGHSVNGYAIGNGTWFKDEEGNIKTPKAEHVFGKDGKCIYCGINQDSKYNLPDQVEHYAYQFIHHFQDKDHDELKDYLAKTFFGGNRDMKFDIIIGNPPYQLDDGGSGASAKPIYQLFIKRAKELNPKYLCMIIPARWYAGGKGLDEFRKEMLNDRHIKLLVDYPNAKDCFPNFSIGGGVCYFVRDKDFVGDCEFVSFANAQTPNSKTRSLNQFDILVRYNEAISLIERVKKNTSKMFSEIVASYCPFGLRSYTRGKADYAPGLVGVYTSQGIQYVERSLIKSNQKLVDTEKVLLSSLTAEHANEPDSQGKYKVLSTMKTISKNTACTDSYLIIGPFSTSEEANNCQSFLKTKFVRFLIMLSVSSIHLTRDTFKFVPLLSFEHPWTDKKLNELYHLSQEDISLINSLIREY